MTSNVNFIARPILQLFVIALYALIQPLNRKITKMVLHLSSGREIRILEPGAVSLKVARKLLLVYLFVQRFIWEPGAFHHPAGANLLFCSCYFKACLSLHLKSYHENYSIKITPVFGNDR